MTTSDDVRGAMSWPSYPDVLPPSPMLSPRGWAAPRDRDVCAPSDLASAPLPGRRAVVNDDAQAYPAIRAAAQTVLVRTALSPHAVVCPARMTIPFSGSLALSPAS